MEDHYERLDKQGFHIDVFQSIELLFLSDDGKRLLGKMCLPEIWKYEHNAFDHAHPAVLDGTFQLIGFLTGRSSVTSSET